MKMKRWQKSGAVLVACGLAAGVSLGASIRYKSSGDWTLYGIGSSPGWQTNYLPTVHDIGRGNDGNNTVTLTTTESIGAIQWGVDESSQLIITGTGNLTTGFTNSCGMGYGGAYNSADAPSTVTIESGGVLTVNTNWNMGWSDAGIGGWVSVDIKAGGTMTVTGEYIQNSTKVIGSTKVSGTLTVGSLTLGNGRILNIDAAGKVVIAKDATAQVEAYIADGTLLGNSVASNVYVVVTTNEVTGITNTTLFAFGPPCTPNYIGLHYTTATAVLIRDGYLPGTLSFTYMRAVNPGVVVAQYPAPGTILQHGSLIGLTAQELSPEAETLNTWLGTDSVWTNAANWTTGDVPLRETQYYKLDIVFSNECVLDTAVGVAWMSVNGGNLRLASGADLYVGKTPTNVVWTGIGYTEPGTLTIESGAMMECVSNMISGFSGNGESVINLNGGQLTVNGTLQMGGTNGLSWAVMNISSGAAARITGGLDYRNGFAEGTDSVINVYEGSLILNGDQTNNVSSWISGGHIVVHSPYYSLTYEGGQTTLNVTDVFDFWAAQWGVNIGTETNDYDHDGFSNFYEYALNGNPTNSLSGGQEPAVTTENGQLKLVFLQRADDPKLTYIVETTDSLMTGIWEDAGYTTLSTTVPNGDYNIVTHIIPVTDAKKFVRLKVIRN